MSSNDRSTSWSQKSHLEPGRREIKRDGMGEVPQSFWRVQLDDPRTSYEASCPRGSSCSPGTILETRSVTDEPLGAVNIQDITRTLSVIVLIFSVMCTQPWNILALGHTPWALAHPRLCGQDLAKEDQKTEAIRTQGPCSSSSCCKDSPGTHREWNWIAS